MDDGERWNCRSREGLQGRELRGHFRWRLHELPLPVARHTVPPASAATTLVSSSSSSVPLSLLASGPGGWMAWSLAFLTPLFHRRPLSFASSVREPSLLSGAGPRCSETSHNGVTWPLLSRARTLRSYPIAYTSSLPRVAPSRSQVPPSSVFVLHYACLLPDKWRARRRDPFGPNSCMYVYNTGCSRWR